MQQPVEDVRVEGIGHRVERHRYVRLRGGHQVDRQAVVFEDLKDVGQEAHLLPHAERVHAHGRNVGLGRDRLHLGPHVGPLAAYDRAVEGRGLGAADVKGDLVAPRRVETAGVEHPRAHRRQLLGLVVVQAAQQPPRRHLARVRREQARHVGPYLGPLGLQLGRKVGRRRVRAAPPEQNGLIEGIARDEALREVDGLRGVGETGLQPRVGVRRAICGQILAPRRQVRVVGGP
ncbi:hypothetical protein GGP85_000509 [Salinibacter ruber]|nr:hypothetical protein [Salinibacter ruber]MCS3825078.1 hypothetical protein [Salinibacter ruber]